MGVALSKAGSVEVEAFVCLRFPLRKPFGGVARLALLIRPFAFRLCPLPIRSMSLLFRILAENDLPHPLHLRCELVALPVSCADALPGPSPNFVRDRLRTFNFAKPVPHCMPEAVRALFRHDSSQALVLGVGCVGAGELPILCISGKRPKPSFFS